MLYCILSACRETNKRLSGNRGAGDYYFSSWRASMRVIKERSAVAGKKAAKDKDSQPKPSTKKDSEFSPPASLGQRLRQWGRDKDWHQSGRILNSLSLKRAYGKLIGEATDEFLSRGLVKLALQVKADFESLLDKVKRFDVYYHHGCVDEYQAQACELLQEQIHTAIDDLAALLDNRDLGGDVNKAAESNPRKHTSAQSSATSAAGSDTWMTFGQASEILAVSKPTLTRWVTGGKLVCNSQTGRGRKLSKMSVLFHKQAIEDMDRMNDAKDLRREENRLDALHRR
jgi:hypothetical protein